MNGIKDVAQKAGVSISTVSNVLNGKRYVSPELAQRVRAAARELAYEANPIAQRMKSNHSGIIGIITGDMYGVFYPCLLYTSRSSKIYYSNILILPKRYFFLAFYNFRMMFCAINKNI